MYVLGIDPDVKAHGVALYKDGDLIELHNLTLVELLERDFLNADFVAIENVKANNAIFERKGHKMMGYEKQARSRSLGALQHSQTELERFLEWRDIKYKLYRISKKWKHKDKKEFERVTGWTKRSNEDTRSAAYFGYLAVCDNRQARLLKL